MKKYVNTKKLAMMGFLTALVILLQAFVQIRFGVFAISTVLVPIVIGGALYGCAAGAWLGFVFGLVVLISGDATPFMAVNAGGTILTVLLKGAAAGFVAGFVYKALEKVNRYVAVVAAAICCPVVNTGVFLIACRVFFFDTIKAWGEAAGFTNVATYMIVGLVGINFLLELAANVVLSPTAVRIIDVVKKKK